MTKEEKKIRDEVRQEVLEECAQLAFETASDFARNVRDRDGTEKHEGAFTVGVRIQNIRMQGMK